MVKSISHFDNFTKWTIFIVNNYTEGYLKPRDKIGTPEAESAIHKHQKTSLWPYIKSSAAWSFKADMYPGET